MTTKKYICKGCMTPCILEVGICDDKPSVCPYNSYYTGAWELLYSKHEHEEDIKEMLKA